MDEKLFYLNKKNVTWLLIFKMVATAWVQKYISKGREMYMADNLICELTDSSKGIQIV